jgi:hypothetical protein
MNGEITISFFDDKTEYMPGEKLKGTVAWEMSPSPEKIVIDLFWYIDGMNSRDSETVEEIKIEAFANSGSQDFSFKLPAAPYSYIGNFGSLQWAVEASPRRGKVTGRREFVMSPSGKPLELKRVEVPESGFRKLFAGFNKQ